MILRSTKPTEIVDFLTAAAGLLFLLCVFWCDHNLGASWDSGGIFIIRDGLLAHNVVNLSQNLFERLLYICAVQGTCLNEGQSLPLAESLQLIQKTVSSFTRYYLSHPDLLYDEIDTVNFFIMAHPTETSHDQIPALGKNMYDRAANRTQTFPSPRLYK